MGELKKGERNNISIRYETFNQIRRNFKGFFFFFSFSLFFIALGLCALSLPLSLSLIIMRVRHAGLRITIINLPL
jgi:hypothetical protein